MGYVQELKMLVGESVDCAGKQPRDTLVFNCVCADDLLLEMNYFTVCNRWLILMEISKCPHLQRLMKLFCFGFAVKKEEALKRSLEEKNSQIYIQRSRVSLLRICHFMVWSQTCRILGWTQDYKFPIYVTHATFLYQFQQQNTKQGKTN